MSEHMTNRVKEELQKAIVRFGVNQYSQTINVDSRAGNYVLLDKAEILRIVKDIKESLWFDGKDRPSINYTPNLVMFNTDFTISQTIKYFSENHCFNDGLKKFSEKIRIGRTKAVARELFNPKNYDKSHVIDVGTRHCVKESSISYSILENSVDEAIKRIHLDTAGNVGTDALVLVLGKEANDRLKLPESYHGVKVICDNDLDKPLRHFNEISPDSAVICARFNRVNIPLEPNFSTCVIFAMKKISFEPIQTGIAPGKLSLTITENYCARVIAPVSGVLLTNLFSESE